MPDNGKDILICNIDFDAAHFSRVSRLHSQLLVKSYNKIKFAQPVKASDLKKLSSISTELSAYIQNEIDPSSISDVAVSIPTQFGYMDSFKKGPNFSLTMAVGLGKSLIENGSKCQIADLNYQIIEKNQLEYWLFAIEKKLVSQISNLFSSKGLKVSAIVQNAITLENYFESVKRQDTSVFIDISSEFLEMWLLNNSKAIADWKLILRNDIKAMENVPISDRLRKILLNLEKHYSLKISEVHYCGIKDKNDINQLFNSDSQYNLKEGRISDLVALAPEIKDLSEIKDSNKILIKIAGTSLSIN